MSGVNYEYFKSFKYESSKTEFFMVVDLFNSPKCFLFSAANGDIRCPVCGDLRTFETNQLIGGELSLSDTITIWGHVIEAHGDEFVGLYEDARKKSTYIPRTTVVSL
jgi:ribosomal protein S27E